jgi:hypothetical protein
MPGGRKKLKINPARLVHGFPKDTISGGRGLYHILTSLTQFFSLTGNVLRDSENAPKKINRKKRLYTPE